MRPVQAAELQLSFKVRLPTMTNSGLQGWLTQMLVAMCQGTMAYVDAAPTESATAHLVMCHTPPHLRGIIWLETTGGSVLGQRPSQLSPITAC
jgi:hypothetical protein